MSNSSGLLIFDFDGTLFQAKPVVLRAVRDFALDGGFDTPSDSTVYKNAGKGSDALLNAVLPHGVDLGFYMPLYAEALLAAITECGVLFDGVYEALVRLYTLGYTLTVCSVSGTEYIKHALEVTGTAGFFTESRSAGSGGKAQAVASLTAAYGSKALVIGDTHGDIEAAEANGLPSVAVLYGYGNKDMLKNASVKIESGFELAAAVEKLFASVYGL